MKRIALYPGSFDPITNGHIDLIRRSSQLYDEVVIAISFNSSNKNLFSIEERIGLAKESLKDIPNVSIIRHTGGLTVDVAASIGANVILRGIRNTQDFEYESNIATLNKTQNSSIETVVLIAAEHYRFLSSSMIKEIALFGGDISLFVPPVVETAIYEKYKNDVKRDLHAERQ